jgi:hypothetical protein
MSVSGFVVTLRDDVNGEHGERIAQAIRMLAGVADVRPVESGFETHVGRMQGVTEARERIVTLLRNWET